MKFSLAFITGATSGIGEELAKLLRSKGIELILTGRDEEKLKKMGHPYFACDLADRAQREKLFSWAISHQPDLWINNAGFGLYGPFDQLNEQEIEAMVEVNMSALTEGTHLALRYFLKNNLKGTILNVSSMSTQFAFPLGALYSATKAYVRQLTISLDAEYRSRGINFLVNLPGVVKTDFQSRAARGKAVTYPPLAMNVRFAAKEIWRQIEHKKREHRFDWRYRFLQKIQAVLPQSFADAIITRALKKRI